MAVEQRMRPVRAQLALMLAIIFGLALLDALTLRLFFVLSFLGFLVVIELTAPFAVAPRWRRRLRWVILVGFLILSYIIVTRILEVLALGRVI